MRDPIIIQIENKEEFKQLLRDALRYDAGLSDYAQLRTRLTEYQAGVAALMQQLEKATEQLAEAETRANIYRHLADARKETIELLGEKLAQVNEENERLRMEISKYQNDD